MNSSKKEMHELSTLLEHIGNELTDEYHVKFSELFAELNLYDDDNDGPIPLEIWLGVAQAVADASGYRVILQGAIFQPDLDDPSLEHVVGHREIGKADPTLFVKPASE
jgi:hypothetical protein